MEAFKIAIVLAMGNVVSTVSRDLAKIGPKSVSTRKSYKNHWIV